MGKEMTEKQLSTLRHMLGINDPSKLPEPYRNHAAVNPGDPYYEELERLGMIELVAKAGSGIWSTYDCYRCTEEGKRVAIRSHRTIRWSKARRRYHQFLGIREALPDLTFQEFLTNDEFSEYRENC